MEPTDAREPRRDPTTPDAAELPWADIVLQGGIASGVVYPLAVAELSRTRRFKNLGGASAGAIAAAMAAAAEHGRRTRPPSPSATASDTAGGFHHMDAMVADIAARLPDLFQPTPALRPVYRAALALVGRAGSGAPAALRAVGALARGWPGVAAVGAAPGGAVLGLVLSTVSAPAAVRLLLLALAVALAAVGALAALGWRAARMVGRELPKTGFGLCPGLRQPGGRGEGLTEWIAAWLERSAGLSGSWPSDGNQIPLTFGHLWGEGGIADPDVVLEVMTTNLSRGVAERLPFRRRTAPFVEDAPGGGQRAHRCDPEPALWFAVEEWAPLFPPHVLSWLVAHSTEGPRAGLRRLPPAADLPVVVAVRMSLSYPVLLSAVPLYERDPTRSDGSGPAPLVRVWFSDGGICSNFPIHFFDAPWPRWPTLGITLDPAQAEHRVANGVRLPADNRDRYVHEVPVITSLAGFFGAGVTAMQSWQERLQLQLPTYRDRVVSVGLEPHEGGLNLDMAPALVRELAERGRRAGRTLAERFDWDPHRWRRMLVWAAKLEEILEGMRVAWNEPGPGDEKSLHAVFEHATGPALVDRSRGRTNYAQTRAWAERAEEFFEDLFELMDHGSEQGKRPLRSGRIPRPDVAVRLTPRA